jgi:hypothetical protein
MAAFEKAIPASLAGIALAPIKQVPQDWRSAEPLAQGNEQGADCP